MKLELVTLYSIDGVCFDSVKKAQKHVEDKLFKHVQNGTAYAGAGSEQSKMRLELMRYLMENKKEIASLLSADFSLEDDD